MSRNPALIRSRAGTPLLERANVPGAVTGLNTTAPFDISVVEYTDRAHALGYKKSPSGHWYHAGLDFFVAQKTRADGSVARHATVLALARQAESMRKHHELKRYLVLAIAALTLLFTAAVLSL